MLTPYEIGKEIGRRQSGKSIGEIRNLAFILGFRGDENNEFAEGYLGGTALEEQDDETPPWLPNAAELDEIEEGIEADEEPDEEPYIDPSESLEDIAEKERELRGGGHCPDCGDPLCYGCDPFRQPISDIDPNLYC